MLFSLASNRKNIAQASFNWYSLIIDFTLLFVLKLLFPYYIAVILYCAAIKHVVFAGANSLYWAIVTNVRPCYTGISSKRPSNIYRTSMHNALSYILSFKLIFVPSPFINASYHSRNNSFHIVVDIVWYNVSLLNIYDWGIQSNCVQP